MTPQPGQFVMLHSRDREGMDPLLGRPLSVYDFQRQRRSGTLEVFYRVIGKGTRNLSRIREKGTLNVLGPLGTGFHTPASVTHVVLIAGGMGVAPITHLACHYRSMLSSNVKITCYLGGQDVGSLARVGSSREILHGGDHHHRRWIAGDMRCCDGCSGAGPEGLFRSGHDDVCLRSPCHDEVFRRSIDGKQTSSARSLLKSVWPVGSGPAWDAPSP